MDEHITQQPLSGTNDNVVAADGTGAGSEEAVMDAKDFMKEVLGKEYPTNEAAIKSLKDTFAYVGSMGQKVTTLEQQLADAQKQTATPEVMEKISSLEKQIAEGNFYQTNPQYNTPEAKALIGKFGGKPEEVVNDDVFKTAFGAIQKTAEIDKSKSVLHTNPRLGTAQDTLSKASEAQKAGNTEAAANAATMAVLEAYNIS